MVTVMLVPRVSDPGAIAAITGPVVFDRYNTVHLNSPKSIPSGKRLCEGWQPLSPAN